MGFYLVRYWVSLILLLLLVWLLLCLNESSVENPFGVSDKMAAVWQDSCLRGDCFWSKSESVLPAPRSTSSRESSVRDLHWDQIYERKKQSILVACPRSPENSQTLTIDLAKLSLIQRWASIGSHKKQQQCKQCLDPTTMIDLKHMST